MHACIYVHVPRTHPCNCQAKSKSKEDLEESETSSDEGVDEGESKHVKYASDDEGSQDDSEADDSWFNEMCESHLKVVECEKEEEPSDALPLDIDLESQDVESQWRLAEPVSPRPISEGDSHEKSDNPIVLDIAESPKSHDAKQAGDPVVLTEEERAARVRLLNMKLRHIELELEHVERRGQPIYFDPTYA